MLIVTVDQIQDMDIQETFSVVQGSTVRSRAVGRDIIAILRLSDGK